ncbi:MAG: DUF3383 family protein [Burkholderiaceae bacterium]|nr:DUF3383 family protein [Burkholderiaceae bacterium]
MLPLSQIVNVQLNVPPIAPFRRNFGLVALFSPEAVEVLGGDKYGLYPDQASIETAYGTLSDTAAATRPFFSQTPRPKQILIAPWNAGNAEPQDPTVAMAALQDVFPGWYAATFAGLTGDTKYPLTDAQIEAIGDWVLSSDKKIFGVTTNKPDHIEQAESNPFKKLFDKLADRVLAIYDKNDPYAVMSLLARGLSVNFAANNSTITLKFKQLPGVSADDLSLTEVAKCKALGINYYTYYDEAAMVAEGTTIGKRFFDEIHGLDWFVDAVQKNYFATLYQSPTKVPQTDPGTAKLTAAIEKACQEGVKNGLIAPGIWTGDPFGMLETGDRLDEGFYVWADTVDTQPTSDREQRAAVPHQVAIKLAGAIHSGDILVNFSR